MTEATAKVGRSSNRGSKPGERRGGRQKGTPNKLTAAFKDAVMSVYDDLQGTTDTAHGHFLDWAKSTPTEFYKIASKLLPLQVGGDPNAPIIHQIQRSIVRPDNPDR